MQRLLALILICTLPLPGAAAVRVRVAPVAPSAAVVGGVSAVGANLAPLPNNTLAAPSVLSLPAPILQAPQLTKSLGTQGGSLAAQPAMGVAVPLRAHTASGGEIQGRTAKEKAAVAAPSFRQRLQQTSKKLEALTPGKKGSGAALAASRELFDGSGDFTGDSGDWPKLPSGAVSVRAEIVRNAKDVDRLIRVHSNSMGLIAELKKRLRRRGPLTMLVYTDQFGKTFLGMDLHQDPTWLDDLPDVDPHEAHHIRKILRYFPDVQVMVREEGKTPDLIINGVMTELKADFGNFSLKRLIDKANKQVDEFNRRHMLNTGDVAIDLRAWDQVPKDDVQQRVNDWASRKRYLALDRIWVYAGEDDVQILVKGSDNRYHWQDEDIPEAPSRPELESRRILEVQLLAKKGRINEAQRRLAVLERELGQGDEDFSPLKQAREAIAAYRTLGRIRRFASRPGGMDTARSIWAKFQSTHMQATVREIAGAVFDLLGDPPPDVPVITEGALRDYGVHATVAVYGGERVRPRADAEHGLRTVQKRVGSHPRRRAPRQRLARARRAVRMSRYYEEAKRFGKLVAQNGRGALAIATNGSAGIAAAANRGAFENGGPSTAFRLEAEGEPNPYITRSLEFRFPHDGDRDSGLRSAAAAHIFFPGGFSTSDDFLSILTGMESNGLPRGPIILVGHQDAWERDLSLDEWQRRGLISAEIRSQIVFVKNATQAWAAVKSSLE
jgi:predicted Rossmann-fold nucleotide-binding protein